MPPMEPPETQKSLLDAQMVEQHGLGLDHVADRDDRKVEAPGAPCRRVDLLRPAGSHAAAERVAADHEVTVGIEGLAGSHHQLPPAGFAGDRVGAYDELIAGERVTEQHRVGAFLVERAVSLIGEREWPEARRRNRARAASPGRARRSGRSVHAPPRLGSWALRSSFTGLRAAASPHRIAGRKSRRKGVRQLRFEPESQCSL